MLKWVSATSRQRARLSKAMTSTTWTRTRTWTTSNMATINFAALLLTMLSIIAALVQPTNGFTPIEMNSAEGRKLFGGYRITPKHCRATKTLPLSDPRTNGPTICMFNHECAQRNGEVVGACMDGFLFGACCQIPSSQDLESTLLNDAQNSYYQQHQQQKLQLQQSISNPAAAQSYETYGEHQQQSQANNYHRPMQQHHHSSRPSQQQQQHKRPPPTDLYEQDNLNKVYQQLETSTSIAQQHNDIYDQANIDKVYQQLESSSNAYAQQPDNNNNNYQATAISSTVFDEPQQSLPGDSQQDNSQQQPEIVNSSQQSEQTDAFDSVNSDASTQSMNVELEHEAQLHTEPAAGNTNSLASEHQLPPKFHVHKDSVKISSPSSSPHNDDFVMQVLSTLPPNHDNDHITFTTEVPMKIASHLAEHTSSESSSFEELPATQHPVMPSEKPLKSNSQQHKQQQPQKQQQHKNQQPPKQQQQQQQQQQEAHSGEEQSSQQSTNTHHHNHLLLHEAEFTHSDITHPGADADLIEDDLQFSTGYGPQPVYVAAPSDKQPSVSSHKTSTTAAPAPAENQYVLVQTISNEQLSKKPVSASAPTTSSSITTHVDSIESIILQLNGSSHGPTYNVVNQQTPSYGSNDDINSASKYEEHSTSYDGAAVDSALATTLRPLAAGTTTISSAYYGEVETKRPDDYYTENELPSSQQKYTGSSQTQVPAYLEPVTTHLNPKPSPSYDTTASVEEENPTNSYLQNEYPSSKPGDSPISTAATSYAEDTSSVLDEHTMPSSGYNDAAQSSSHATSEFNKMPAVGIAYPVDMSYMEEEGNLDGDDNGANAGYGDASQSAPVSSTDKTDTEIDESYSKVPVIAGKPQRPQVASYIGMVTSQNYSPKPSQAPLYSQLPDEVSVSSHTTKIQEDYSVSPAYQTSTPEKFTTINYNDDAPTSTLRPSTTSTGTYISSTSTPVALRPQYDSAVPTDASTSQPISGIITSSGTRPRPRPRPKPTTTRPKRPNTTGNKKTTKPGSNKKPPAQPTSSYPQDSQPSNSYTQQQGSIKRPAQTAQPTNTYSEPTHKKPAQAAAAQPASSYGGENTYQKKKKPVSSTYNAEQDNVHTKQPSLASYGQQKPAKQPAYVYQQQQQKKPAAPSADSYNVPQASNNYNAGTPTKKPASHQSSNYYQQQQHHVEQDSSYGQNVKLSAQPSLSNNYQQQQHIEQDSSYGQNIKLPSLTYNQDQHIASSPTRRPSPTSKPPSKKPVSTSYVTGPSSPRPPTTFHYHDEEVPPLIIAHDKLDSFVQSTTATVATAAPTAPSYAQSIYLSSVTPVHVQRPQNGYKKPGFVKVQATVKPPVPTVLITPKPTVINLITASSWGTQSHNVNGNIDSAYPATTPIPLSSTSYIYSPLVTRRPEFTGNTPEYVNLPAVTSNDFDDPGYYGAQNIPHPAFAQATTEAVFGVPSDDRPAFPGYYGPTPTYPAFVVPGEKVGAPVEEETFTSPNDFVNFPPVRNPNLNMSASSSAVTTDLELSTPAFVEDVVLKDKMNTLVHKIVESLQGNFEALADMIDETNHTAAPAAPAATYQSQSTASSASTTGTRRPTRKPTTRVTTAKPKATTKRPATRATTKTPTRRPTSAVTRRTTTTRKPATRKPTRRTTTTTSAPTQDELVDEEDEEDVNPSDNEIGNQEELLSGAGGRKFKCGVRPHIKSGRIVGGKGSTFGAYPWQVLVRESTWLGLFTKNKCGGVLITNRYVITAAHCQPGFLASLVAVLGEFDISGDLESKRAVTKNVKRVIVHRQYDPATFENDLALLELESPVQYDTHIVPICMPNDHADFTGRMATVTGWGRLKYGGGVPSVLQEVQVPIIENSVCQEMFHTAGHNKKILGSFLCAGYANGQKDSCEGDSGGPLVLQRPDGRYELAGTVSHGIKCAAPYLPGVYMRTTFYKPWLRSITGVK